MINSSPAQADLIGLQTPPPNRRDWNPDDFVEERSMAFKAVIEAMGVDHVVYWPALAHRLDSVSAAVLLSQLYYWAERVHHRKVADEDGWYFKSIHELQKETGMGRREIESARAVLIEFGLIDWFVGGMPRTTYYRVNMPALTKLVMDAPLDQTLPITSASSTLSRDRLSKALGRPVLLNRTIAHLTGGINCGVYLSALIYEIKTQVKDNDDEPAWVINTKLEDITRSLALTTRQTEYARNHLRQLGVLREFRKGIPAITISAVNWGKLSTRLIEYANNPKIFGQIGKKNDVNLGGITAKQAEDALSACSKDSFQHVRRNPSNKTLQKRHTGLDKNATLDITKTPNKTLQKRPTETAFLSDPHVLDYAYIKPPPPTSVFPLTTDARSQNQREEEVKYFDEQDDLPNHQHHPGYRSNPKPQQEARPHPAVTPLVVSRLIPQHLHDSVLSVLQPLLLQNQKNAALESYSEQHGINPNRLEITAQNVLDELGGRVRNPAMPPLHNVMAYERRLVQKALMGTLVLEAAYGEAHTRKREELEQTKALQRESEILPQRTELEEKELDEKRNWYRKMLGFKVRQ